MIKRQGEGVRETFTVRKQSFGVGVERTFPLHSPKIERIEVAARGDVRRAKLYYLRGRVGKRARVRERRYTGPEEVVEAGLLHDPAAEAAAAAADGEVPRRRGRRQALAEAADGGADRAAATSRRAAAAERGRGHRGRGAADDREVSGGSAARQPAARSSSSSSSSPSRSGSRSASRRSSSSRTGSRRESMVPTLEIGQRVLVNRIGARFTDPNVGDVVVFHPPAGAEGDNACGGGTPPAGQACARRRPSSADVNFIKRVVAGPGDRIAIDDGHVILNGKRQKEPFARPCGGGEGCDYPQRDHRFRAGHYFMMGDNRGSSDDSRFWGPVPSNWIIGGAFATYWPPKPHRAPLRRGRRRRDRGTSARAQRAKRRALDRLAPVPVRPRARLPLRGRRRRGRARLPRRPARRGRGAVRPRGADPVATCARSPRSTTPSSTPPRRARRCTRACCARPRASRSPRAACAASTSAACTTPTSPRCATCLPASAATGCLCLSDGFPVPADGLRPAAGRRRGRDERRHRRRLGHRQGHARPLHAADGGALPGLGVRDPRRLLDARAPRRHRDATASRRCTGCRSSRWRTSSSRCSRAPVGATSSGAHVVAPPRARIRSPATARSVAPPGIRSPAERPARTTTPLGRLGEQLAAEHFGGSAAASLARSHRTRFGELDLVVADGDTLVFCEVKTCRPGAASRGTTCTTRKRSQVRRMASAWLTEVRDRPVLRRAAVRRDRRGRRRPRRARRARPPRGGVLMPRRASHASRSTASRRAASGSRPTSAAGLPAFTVVGLADKAVREARERVRAAIVNSGFEFPAKRITVNLAPAYLRKDGPGFDLPLAIAVLAASGQLAPEALAGCAVVGELSLDGERPAGRAARSRSPRRARRHGLARLVVPRARAREAALVAGARRARRGDAAGGGRGGSAGERGAGAGPRAPSRRADDGRGDGARPDRRPRPQRARPGARDRRGRRAQPLPARPAGHRQDHARPAAAVAPAAADAAEAIEVTRVHSIAGLHGGGGLVRAAPVPRAAPHDLRVRPGRRRRAAGAGRGDARAPRRPLPRRAVRVHRARRSRRCASRSRTAG